MVTSHRDSVGWAMDCGLSRSQFLLLIAVLTYGPNAGGRIPWRRLHTIAHIGSDKVLSRTLRELEGMGLLHIYRHMNGGMRLATEYRVDMEALHERYRNRILRVKPIKKRVCATCGQQLPALARGELETA